MEHHVTWLTLLVNKYLGSFALALLDALHIHPESRETPIPEFVVMGWLVFAVTAVFVLWLKKRLSVDRPGASQQVIEILVTNPTGFGIRDLLDSNVGHRGRQYLAMVGSVAIFILVSNLISVFPVFTSPTGHPSVPLACALVTFIYFNWQGMRVHGVGGYLLHFAGPPVLEFAHKIKNKEIRGGGHFLKEAITAIPLGLLLFPVEIISTSARILSLTVRLWANMFSSELVYVTILGLLLNPMIHLWDKWPPVAVFVGIFTATIPVLFVGLHIFVAVVQALVFTILPTVYLGIATAEEH